MSQARRFVEKIEPQTGIAFDQQFWPVLVALCVLSSVAMGAILTLLHGPWMWTSLLVLPAAVAVAIFSLHRLDNALLRRSLQFALIVSLAGHLAVLIAASVFSIFGHANLNERPEMAQSKPKTIMITSRSTPFVWQKSDKKKTPEVEVEVERQQSTTTVQQQMTPVETPTESLQPQVVRREKTQQTVPRFDQEMSQLRRQTSNVKPKSSVSAATSSPEKTKTAVAEVKPKTSQPVAAPTEVSKSQNTAQANASRSASPVQPKTEQTVSPTAQRRETAVASAASTQSRPTTSRVERTRTRMPRISRTSIAKRATQTTPTPKTAETRPIKVFRRNAKSNAARAPSKVTPTPTRSTAKAARRRNSETTQPTLTRPDASTTQPRRSLTTAATPMTTAQIAKPAPAASTESNQRRPSTRTLSVSKSETGTAGRGSSSNLATMTGSTTSPAHVASESSATRRQSHQETQDVSLSVRQQSLSGRRVSNDMTPQMTARAETALNAKIAGSTTPARRPMESSAASVESASTAHRSETTAEKGESRVELGSTKIVMEQISERRGGGGQPEISSAELQSKSSPSRTRSDIEPTMLAEAGPVSAAPMNPAAAPTSSQSAVSNEVASTTANEVERAESGESASQREQTNETVPTETGSARLASELTNSRDRAHDESGSSELNRDDDEQENVAQGVERSRVAQSPSVSNVIESGNPESAKGQGEASHKLAGDSNAAKVVIRAADSMAGSNSSRSDTNFIAQSDSSLTRLDNQSQGKRRERSSAKIESSNADPSSTVVRRTAPSATPTVSGNPIPSSDSQTRSTARNESNFKATGVAVDRDSRADESADSGAAMDIDAIEGPAGMGAKPSVRLGVRSRPASEDSPNLTPRTDTRFRRKEFGGTPAINPDAVLARQAFSSRDPGAMSGSGPSTEAAIQSGLEWLARYQLSDGSWTLDAFDKGHRFHATQLQSDTAATGLALLAFQGAGYNHREFKYAAQMQQAIDWLVEHQADDGGLYLSADRRSNAAARMYSHAIAALALTEAYGMTQSADVKMAAQKAIDYIAATQDPVKGGWRYYATPKSRSTDTSVTGWMMMALKSGQLAGLSVDDKTLAGIEDWLGLAQDKDDPSQFRYNPHAVDSTGASRLHGRKPSQSMTAVGLLLRVYSGWSKTDARFVAGANSLLNHLPSDANSRSRDTYYWYYATQVLKHAGGEAWETWNNALHPLLIASQSQSGDMAGSWDPYRPVPDRWGPHGGRLYVTTMNLLSLEVRYRLLPLYEKTVHDEDSDHSDD